MTEPETRPDIAVIIPAFGAASTIGQCLTALQHQLDEPVTDPVNDAFVEPSAVEVLVVASGDDETAKLVRSAFPWVRLVQHDERLYPGAARHLAIATTRASVLAFLDADCVPGPRWLGAVFAIREDNRGAVVVGGPVAADLPLGSVGWAAYLCSFLNWIPDGRQRWMEDIPTCSLVFRRSVYERFGPFRMQGYSSDTEFNWKVVAGGQRLRLVPELEVRHLDRSTLRGFLRRQFERGAAFAAMRTKVRRLSRLRRLLLAGGMVLLPGVLCWRYLRRLATGGVPGPYRWGALRSLPLLVTGFVLWSGGELLRYVRPGGAA